MMPSIKLGRIKEYQKDIEKLVKKRFRHLESDLEIVYSVLKTHPEEGEPKNYRRIPMGKTVVAPIYKLRKIHSTDLQSTQKLRLIYALLNNKEDEIEPIEIYCKDDQENHDEQRVLKYFGPKNSSP